jgi:hypothetical protein
MKRKKKQSMFELTEFCTQPHEDEAIQYPIFEVSSFGVGFFSSLKSAEAALSKYISEQTEDDVYCFFIKEFAVDDLLYSYTESERVYSPAGELIDECLVAELEGDFYGRPPEKIRFKVGDIVEVLAYGHVELGIVYAVPETPDEMKERIAYLIEHYYPNDTNHDFQSGYGDDCYNVYSGKMWDKDDNCFSLYDWKDGDDCETLDFHGHIQSCCLFPPRLPVPENLKNKLISYYNSWEDVGNKYKQIK